MWTLYDTNSIINCWFYLGDPLYSSREPGSALSLGSVGTRRTVYLSEDEPPVTSTPAPQNAAPLLVFNRISTVIGAEPQRSASTPNPGDEGGVVTNATTREKEANTTADNKKKADGAKENAIWYEYGCV